MNNLRLILYFTLAVLLLMIYQAWQHDYGTAVKASPAAVGQAPDIREQHAVPTPVAVTDGAASPVSTPASQSAVGPTATQGGQVVRIVTDVLTLEVATRGGNVISSVLNQYPLELKNKAVGIQLLKPEAPNYFVAQSGLLAASGGKLPSHLDDFQSEAPFYQLADQQQQLEVPLIWNGPDGLQVKKTYRLTRGSYAIEVEQQITNQGSAPISAQQYQQLVRSEFNDPNQSSFVYTYAGAAVYSDEKKFEKIQFKEISDKEWAREVRGGWIAMIQHYFLGAWIPPSDELQHFETKYLAANHHYLVRMLSPTKAIEPGQTVRFQARLLVGPKLQDHLSAVAKGLELTVDYGILTVLAQPIFWLLGKLHNLVGNWGWAIILLTLLIKLVFYKLSETSYRSMANMRKLTPRLQALKDRYGDDRQRLNQAMMEMYKKEKINPLGGCLPILIQIPVFISLYWVLLESVEMRQAPFILWIDNLSVADPYFVLPLIMGVSMYFQQKLNPAPLDPIQQKVMMTLPFVFTVFFAFFPSGLVLYWVVNNILSIAQQWVITRRIESGAD